MAYGWKAGSLFAGGDPCIENRRWSEVDLHFAAKRRHLICRSYDDLTYIRAMAAIVKSFVADCPEGGMPGGLAKAAANRWVLMPIDEDAGGSGREEFGPWGPAGVPAVRYMLPMECEGTDAVRPDAGHHRSSQRSELQFASAQVRHRSVEIHTPHAPVGVTFHFANRVGACPPGAGAGGTSEVTKSVTLRSFATAAVEWRRSAEGRGGDASPVGVLSVRADQASRSGITSGSRAQGRYLLSIPAPRAHRALVGPAARPLFRSRFRTARLCRARAHNDGASSAG
jgi:hypothetical protein